VKATLIDLGISAAGYVPRAALVKKLRAIAAIPKHIFVTAPGGYGKTIAVGQWLASVRGKTAKISVKDADNNLNVFYARIAISLLKLTGNKNPLSDTAISFDRLLDLANSLPEKSPRRYLVVDDMHLIENEEIMNHAPLLATRLPEYICLCIISRAEPTGQLLQTDLFEVITKDDLMFSPEETEWFVMEREQELSPGQIKHLLETTGGWAIYISAILSGNGLKNEKKDKVPMTLSQYLDTRVWGLWSREKRELLLKLAIPEEVTPEMCECLTGESNGRDILEELVNKGNAFLSRADIDTYRFHDLFREFLLERLNGFIDKNEIKHLNDIIAEWYYKHGDYYAGAKHFIYNGDHDGFNRCIAETIRYNENQVGTSSEVRMNFFKQYLEGLSEEFICENLFLVNRAASAAFQSGDTEKYFRYADILHKKQLLIAVKHPELAISNAFFLIIDFRVSFRKYLKRLSRLKPITSLLLSPKSEVRVSSITQNLPFYHRSMRDFSEFYELNEKDANLVKSIFSRVLGDSCEAMIQTVYAGIYYEQGRLLEAAHHANISYSEFKSGIHPEVIFCSHMILSSVLDAMGAHGEADRVKHEIEEYIEQKALFFHPNYMALKTAHAIRKGDKETAKEWLAVYSYSKSSGNLPLYQICRHFTTLRSYIFLEDYKSAITFAKRLQSLVSDYKRPLDQIENGILVSISLWRYNEKEQAVKQLKQVISIAEPFGFTQLFVNEGKELLPLLWMLGSKEETAGKTASFVNRLTQNICKKYNLDPEKNSPPKLTAQQKVMLTCLSKGMTYNEIAAETGIERSTVKYHVLQMYKRLDVHDAQEAIIKAKALGLFL